MPVKKIHSQAIRFNGFTDGMVVPTGAFRESGVDLYAASHTEKTGGTNKVSSYNSDDPKVGLRHIPNEGNGLNNMIGPFTIEAFIIPDAGGVVVHKEGCYTLSYGSPATNGKAVFSVLTRGATGTTNGEQVETPYNIPVILNPPVGEAQGIYDAGADGIANTRRHDLDLPEQPLTYLNAQFTGTDIRLHINGDLVVMQDFGGEERTIQSSSSDLFIGGKGGEFRGIIESVRISRGVIKPKLEPLSKTPDTMGLWDFEDEDDIPELYFYNNRSPAHTKAGVDGTGQNDNRMPYPLVCVGYDFINVTVGGNITQPITLAAGYDYGRFKIRDFPGSAPSSLEMLASHMLSIPIDELPLQSWWADGSGYLDIGATITKSRYHADGLPVSNLNAIVNASGTDPMTGLSFSSYDFNTVDLDADGGANLDPMVNPIERIRIIALDFNNNDVIVQSTFLQGETADAKTTGFLFEHADNTPVWFTLGNGDLLIDPGNELRAKGQMTRARFTQGQRFIDKTAYGNDAYFISSHSRNTNEMKDQSQGASGLSYMTYQAPPRANKLLIWLDADDNSMLLTGNGAPLTGIGVGSEYPIWWINKAPNGYKYNFYGGDLVGAPWRWIKNVASVNSRGGLQVSYANEQVGEGVLAAELWQQIQPNLKPLGKGVATSGMWVNRKGTFGQPGAIPQPSPIVQWEGFHLDHASAVDGTSTTDGDITIYFVITPATNTNSVFNLIYSSLFTPDIELDNGSGVGKVAYANITQDMGNGSRPAAGTPCLVAITLNGNEDGSFKVYNAATGAAPVHSTTLSRSPNANLQFTPSNDIAQAGIDLFGRVVWDSNANINNATAHALPGFIVHEVLYYAEAHTTAQQADVREWAEEKWGV